MEDKFNYVKYIEKELKKRKVLNIGHFPTKEESIKLGKKNIAFKAVVIYHQGLISDRFIPYDYCQYFKVV